MWRNHNSHFAGGMKNGEAALARSLVVPQSVKLRVNHKTQSFTPMFIPRALETVSTQKHTSVLTAALPITAPKGKPPTCPLADEWIHKMRPSHATGQCLAFDTKKRSAGTHRYTPQPTMMSLEISSHRVTNCEVSFVGSVPNRQILREKIHWWILWSGGRELGSDW